MEQMVIIKGLVTEVISMVIQNPFNPLYPVVKGEFQLRPLNFTQKYLKASEKILWPGELLS
jgi:ABC-type dipeptide/oligopeptide/nickel transport system ATPase component